MKHLVLAAVFLVLSGTAAAGTVETALTNDLVLWTIDGGSSGPSLVLSMREGDFTQDVTVPTTDDTAIDAQPRLAWDPVSRSLFLLWCREGIRGDEIRLARRYASGRWAAPIVLAGGTDAKRAGLQLVLTRTKDEQSGDEETLVHAAWWTLRDGAPTAEYALAAFHGTDHLSTALDTLDHLAAVLTAAAQDEDTGAAIHPPLAMVRAEDGVDVAYGAARTTAVTRVQIRPGKVAGNARIWRPSGKNGGRTGAANLVSASDSPVQSFIAGGRVVLYTADARFRYVVLADGRWTPVRMLTPDAGFTTEALVRELRRSVEQDDLPPAAEVK